MAKILNIAGIITGSCGIFAGFYFFDSNPVLALKIVTFVTVGILGTLSFVRHVIFHKSDAKRLGWETDRPDWMFEVGFANLAFSVMGFVSVFASFDIKSNALVILGYAVYLFQACLLHLYRYFSDGKKSPSRFWRSFFLTFVFVVLMLIFVFRVFI